MFGFLRKTIEIGKERIREWRTRSKKYIPQKPLVSVDSAVRLVAQVKGVHMPRAEQVRFFHKVVHPSDARAVRFAKLGLGVSLIWFAIGMAVFFRVSVPAQGGKIIEAVVGLPEAAVPILTLSDADADISTLVYSGLTRRTTDGAVVPDLAEDISLDASRRVYTVRLKEGVVWHDGEPFSARDVLFTYELIQNPQSGSMYYTTFQSVKIASVDDRTITFTLKEPYGEFLSALTVGIMPEHVWGEVAPERLRFGKYALRPVGTGPFAFDTFSKDSTGAVSEYRLKRFDKYIGKLPFIEEVRFVYYPSYESGTGSEGPVEALRKEHVSSISYVPAIYREKLEKAYLTLYRLPLPQYVALFFRTDSGFASDITVRKALSLALDKERVVLDGVAESVDIVNGPILPGYPGYAPTTSVQNVSASNALLDGISTRISAEEYKTIRTKALRAEYGASVATSTATGTVSTENIDEQITEQLNREMAPTQTFFRILKKGGEPLSLRIVTADAGDYARVARVVSDMWREVGVRVDVDVVDVKSIARDRIRDRSYDVLLYSVIVGHDPDQYPFWHSREREYPGLNLSRYASDKADAALLTARAATSTESQSTAYRAWENILQADVPAVFLYMPSYTYAVKNGVHGIHAHRIATPSERFLGISDWYVKQKSVWRFVR